MTVVYLCTHLVPLRHQEVYTGTRQSKLQVRLHQSQICTVTWSNKGNIKDIIVFMNTKKKASKKELIYSGR